VRVALGGLVAGCLCGPNAAAAGPKKIEFTDPLTVVGPGGDVQKILIPRYDDTGVQIGVKYAEHSVGDPATQKVSVNDARARALEGKRLSRMGTHVLDPARRIYPSAVADAQFWLNGNPAQVEPVAGLGFPLEKASEIEFIATGTLRPGEPAVARPLFLGHGVVSDKLVEVITLGDSEKIAPPSVEFETYSQFKMEDNGSGGYRIAGELKGESSYRGPGRRLASFLRRRTAPCECFVAGTLVATEYGLRPIETIREGDRVWSSDDGGEASLERVTHVIADAPKATRAVVVERDGQTEMLETTDEHPFYVIGGQGWTTAANLNPGDPIASLEGRPATIVSSDPTGKEKPTYNFEVENLHDYYVGSLGTLVHNICPAFRRAAGFAEELGLNRPLRLPGGARTIMKYGGIALFVLPLLTDALRSESLQDFSDRASSTILYAALAYGAALGVAALFPVLAPVLAAIAIVGAAVAIYEFAAAFETRFLGSHTLDDAPGDAWDTLSWAASGYFNPELYSQPPSANDAFMYYE
jgi:hypothetical protein